jgi:hypothetical protein
MFGEQNESDTKSLVWYAAYGSNLLKQRFMCYLEGSEFRMNATVLTAPPRCDAGTEIHGDQPFKLRFKLYFAREKTKWGPGGVAFVEIDPVSPPPTFGRAYLLTLPQLRCVAREESGGSHPVDIRSEMLFGPAGSTHEITTDMQGWYRVLLLCGSLDHKGINLPVVTLTGRPEATIPRNPSSLVYRDVIRKGLQETYPEMTDFTINEYLRKACEFSSR